VLDRDGLIHWVVGKRWLGKMFFEGIAYLAHLLGRQPVEQALLVLMAHHQVARYGSQCSEGCIRATLAESVGRRDPTVWSLDDDRVSFLVEDRPNLHATV
jgi:hypothetical protein